MAFRTNKVPAIEERTVSGSSVSFNSAFALPLKACKVSFSATQAGSGDPSPSNPRAISGVSAIGLTANSTPVSISLGEEQFGGELDLLTGELTLTHRHIATTETWSGWTLNVPNNFIWRNLGTYSSKRNSVVICDKVKSAPTVGEVVATQIASGRQSFFDGNLGIRIDPNEYSSLSQFAQAYGACDIVYVLREPITVQLSPTQLSSILGNNTFSTDTGTLEITFADLQEKSASGSVATFNTALAMPLASCNIAVNAWQEGSGEPSPDNVRPIHGFSEVNATRAGKNLFDEEYPNIEQSITHYRPIYVGDGAFTLSSNVGRWQGSNVLFFLAGNVSSGASSYANGVYYDVSRTVNSENGYVTIAYRNYGDVILPNYWVMLELGSTATEYEPYVTPTIYTIQLGQEVYGAEVDVVNGVAHVKYITERINHVDNVSSNYIKSDACDGFMYLRDAPSLTPSSGEYNYLCNCFPRFVGIGIWSNVGYANMFQINSTQVHLNIANDLLGITDYTQETPTTARAKMNEWLSNNVVMLNRPLLTPFDIQLTPTQIETIIGNNTIFADTGDIDLTYKDLDIAKRGNFREVFRLPS